VTVALRTSLVALVLAAPVALPAPAAVAADKPRHDLTVAAKEIGGDGTNRFKMYGAVPTYLGQDLRIERKVNAKPFAAWSKDTTSSDAGRFSFRVYGGKRGSTICYRVVVPATQDHRRTKGPRWCIRTAASRTTSFRVPG
jgi:hypothetical protein